MIFSAIHQNILYNYDNFGQSTCDKCDINILWLHKLEKSPWDVAGGTIKECITRDEDQKCWLAVVNQSQQNYNKI